MFQVKNKVRKYSGFLFTFSILLLLTLPRVFQEGRFMDGMIYGAVARNLSEGQGTFWNLHFSSTLLQPFHEHPPLAFALESLVFQLLGDVYYAEGIYQIIVLLGSAFILFKIFRQHNPTSPLAWLAILLWVTTERVFWCANENMLETTLSFFALLSVFFLGECNTSSGLRKLLYMALASLAILCSFLSKGFVGLFPYAYFFLLWLVSKKTYNFQTCVKDTLFLTAGIALFSLAMLLLFDNSSNSILLYLNQQVFNSVKGSDRVGLRLPFISGFFQQTLLLAALFIFVQLYKLKNRNSVSSPSEALLFLLIGLSAFLPLLVSPKLSFYYLVPSIPYFALAVVLFSNDVVLGLFKNKSLNTLKSTAAILSALLIVLSIGLSITNKGTAARDKGTIAEVHALTKVIEPGMVIAVSDNLHEDWSLFATMQRIGKYSVVIGDSTANYYLAEQSEIVPRGYTLVQKHAGDRLAVFKLTKH